MAHGTEERLLRHHKNGVERNSHDEQQQQIREPFLHHDRDIHEAMPNDGVGHNDRV